MASMGEDSRLDLVIFGATGFVGRLLAGYLAEHAPVGARIGLGGRSAEKLTEVRSKLPRPASSWPLLIADSAEPDSVARLARATRVVATTVGPYRPHGINLVEACVKAGTDYCDLAGEPLFIRESIDRFHDEAAQKGVRIVHCCGFDSVPSELGVLLLHEQALADAAGDLEDTSLVLKAVKGALSGGTLASALGQWDEVRASQESRKLVDDPYALSPDRAEEPDLGDERDLTHAEHDDELDTWIGPFVMAGINTRVVRRSNALRGWAYGRRFRYREVMDFGDSVAGAAMASAVGAGMVALQAGAGFGPTRAILERVLPAPGEGPNDKARKTGFFKIAVHSRTASGARYVARVEAQGDPGYAATSVILGESALCLAFDGDELPKRGGVLTPSTAMGLTLVERLRGAGQTLTAQRLDS
jgi:short subunit dehydrogenase-like uncharacterized protein